MPKVLEAAENASPDLFPQLSSPTEEALVPGRYVMWVRDPATATARRADRRQGWRREEGTAPGAACPGRHAAMTSGARVLGRHRRCGSRLRPSRSLESPQPQRRHQQDSPMTETGAASTFAALASAAIVALAMLPFIVRRGAGRRPIWLTLAVVALALGVASFSAGGYAQRACTARYGGQTDHHRHGADDARSDVQEEPTLSLSNDELLFDAAGVPDRIWTRSSIDACRTFVSSTYFLWIPFLVVCLLATVQVMPTAALPVVLRDAPAPANAAGRGRAGALRRLHQLSARWQGHRGRQTAGRSARSGRLRGGDRRAGLSGQCQLPAGDGTVCPREPLHGGGDLVADIWRAETARKKRSSARCSTWATESAG